MANTEVLTLLDERLIQLEDKVYGNQPKDEKFPEVLSTLTSLSTSLGNALGTRDRMMMVMKRLDELERYIDPNYGASTLPDGVKLDLIMAREENLRSHHQQLNTLHSLKPVLDSEHIKAVASMTDQLNKVTLKHSEQEAGAKEQNENIRDMLLQYNDIIGTLTATFARMDEIVTEVEIAALPKKIED
ncbi:dynactin 3, p24 subunit [Oratosquilla oratoria]|uniref:dynactin 3, p24 subunit n=1 Tax=Oratosquilla oratoria TaxID=337810 RepID=UPI003F7589AE